MTTEQYERWLDFAQRMACVVFASSWRPSSAWILERVTTFITGIDEFVAIHDIEDWDNSKSKHADKHAVSAYKGWISSQCGWSRCQKLLRRA